MKFLLSFFCRCLFTVLICFSSVLQSADLSYCDSFLTCVQAPQGCKKSCANQRCFGKTFFSIRPQDSNSAGRLIRMINEDHLQSWGVKLALGLQQSFSGNHNPLAKWFLFNGTDHITVGIPDDQQHFDVDGRQLGLTTVDGSAGQIGSLCLNPVLQNIIANVDAWVDLNALLCGLWLRTYLTIVRAKTTLGMKSITGHAAQSGNYPAGANTTNCNESPIQYTSICQAFIGDTSFGDIPALQYGKFYSDTMTKTALASIRFDLGYDVAKSSNGFFNCGACFIIPTGNKPNGLYIFEPVVGANGSWQLGAVMSGAYNCLYTSERTAADVCFDATLTYVCKSKQTRVFSLKNNGAGSQYMLLKEFDLSVGAVLAGQRVANVFAGQANIGGNVMFDGSVMLHVEKYNGLFFDIGYNLWARSKENISKNVCMRNFAENTYGIKGDLPLSKVDPSSALCIGDLTTATKSTLGVSAPADVTTMVLDVCDIDFCSPLHPSVFSNKLFAACGFSNDVNQCKASMNVLLEGEIEFGQKHLALNQWALNINVGFLL